MPSAELKTAAAERRRQESIAERGSRIHNSTDQNRMKQIKQRKKENLEFWKLCRCRFSPRFCSERHLLSWTINHSDTVSAVALSAKQKIQDREGMYLPISSSRLAGGCVELKEGRILSEHGIEKESTLHLVLKLRGCSKK
eukprot:jgi/Bigna1/51942/estExt_Genewise1Plus.C_40166